MSILVVFMFHMLLGYEEGAILKHGHEPIHINYDTKYKQKVSPTKVAYLV